ncbi:PAS domain S-box protein [Colwellia sp. 12G3]|uniref:PAS domain S-box protein n=1 Tax=Colwellia sp. 12G3 TaxID=2058299 RepID=UPI000C33A898|nr:PAS domain-containing protein [Colwellia sp. 12G3]PKI13519.1 diguanylate cyclase [Colwellia sp. 12G3]
MFTENPVDFIEKSSIGIHAVSPDGVIKYANQFELDILGYSKDEYIGHHVSEFQIDKDCLSAMMTKLEKFETLLNYPAKVNGKNQIKYIIYNSSVYESEGEFIHTRCFGNEVSKEIYDVFYDEYKRRA